MEAEVAQLVKRGLWSSFPDLRLLRQWQPYTALRAEDGLVQGTRALSQALRLALDSWARTNPHDAGAMAVLLSLDNVRAKRVLTGANGLREAAGRRYFNVGHDQFGKKFEGSIILSFATFIESWTISASGASSEATQLDFRDLEKACVDLHRLLERQFEPDLVITMSGPGSFAACYMMHINTRDVPVAMAVTFPMRSQMTSLEQSLARAAIAEDSVHLTTSKWSVYLPGFIRYLEKGSRIALVDDRVVSGETQREARKRLESFGLQVACAALFASGPVPIDDLMVGRIIKGPFNMPWGTSRGRE